MRNRIPSAVTSFCLATSLCLASGLIGCGPQPADHVAAGIDHRPPPDEKPRFGSRGEELEVDGLSGTMDEADVRNVMAANMAGFNNCFAKTPGSYVAGEVQLKFIIDADGRVKSVSVDESTLGSLAIEDCLIESGKFLEFPPPHGGGNARFLYPLSWNEAASRLSVPVDAAWGYEALRKHDPAIQQCRRTHSFIGPFYLTSYVGRGGMVLSAGFHSKTAPPPGFPDCVVQSLQDMRFPNPGTKIAKYVALVENLPEGR